MANSKKREKREKRKRSKNGEDLKPSKRSKRGKNRLPEYPADPRSVDLKKFREKHWNSDDYLPKISRNGVDVFCESANHSGMLLMHYKKKAKEQERKKILNVKGRYKKIIETQAEKSIYEEDITAFPDREGGIIFIENRRDAEGNILPIKEEIYRRGEKIPKGIPVAGINTEPNGIRRVHSYSKPEKRKRLSRIKSCFCIR